MKSKLPKKEKLTWLTECPVCGKSHSFLWVFLLEEKKSVYKGVCPKTKKEFEIILHI